MSGSAIIQSAEGSIVVIRASFNDDNDWASGKVQLYQCIWNDFVLSGSDIDGKSRDKNGYYFSFSGNFYGGVWLWKECSNAWFVCLRIF